MTESKIIDYGETRQVYPDETKEYFYTDYRCKDCKEWVNYEYVLVLDNNFYCVGCWAKLSEV